jgi:hypothetical protein
MAFPTIDIGVVLYVGVPFATCGTFQVIGGIFHTLWVATNIMAVMRIIHRASPFYRLDLDVMHRALFRGGPRACYRDANTVSYFNGAYK